MTPQRNNYFLLDSVAGWRMGYSSGIHFTAPDGDITLDPLPGSATFLDASLVTSMACPVALATDSMGRVFVMDGVNDRVTILSLDSSRTQRVEAFGGRGTGLRRFNAPRSLTILPSGAVAVADTGNHRIQLFSGPPYVLLRVWGAHDVRIRPNAVASDHCGIIYIADGASRSILRVRVNGEWLEPIGAGVLTNPMELAVAADQTLAVVDGSGANASIVIFAPDGGESVRLSLIGSPRSLTFDSFGNLYSGTANAIVAKLEPDSAQLSGWSLGGEGVSDVDGTIGKLAWVEGRGLVAILNSSEPGTAPRLIAMNPAGAFRLAGSFFTAALDSRIETCSWHRIQLMGTVPKGASVSVTSSTCDGDNWTPFVPCAVLGGDSLDCLVQSPPGQRLRLGFDLKSNGVVTPQIHALQIFFPRESYLQYLPAVFQDDDESRLFLDRFLSIFQTTFDDMDSRLDNLADLFDPVSTPANVFPWLAAWIAQPIDPTMPLERQRQLLKNAFLTNRAKGSVAGLRKVIEDYLGISATQRCIPSPVPPNGNVRILEHYRLRNWISLPASGRLNEGARLFSENLYARLQVGVASTIGSFKLTNPPPPSAEPFEWGANQFSVFFPANPYTAAETSAAVQKVLDREKPAYTQAFLSPVFPRLRVGVQATLGVDAYVGKANAMILGRLATLNYDAVLARSQADRDVQALGLSLYPRLGEDARIL
jgi:phage tail-like protein